MMAPHTFGVSPDEGVVRSLGELRAAARSICAGLPIDGAWTVVILPAWL